MRCAIQCWSALGTLLVWGAGVFAAHGGAAKPDLSRLAPGYGGIVFTRTAAGSAKAAGSQLVLLSPDGTERVLTAGFAFAADPAVSFDGKRILFAGKRRAADLWNIFEMAADGSGIRQVTHEMGNCRSPIYQSALFYLDDARPSYQLAFSSDMAEEAAEDGKTLATSLYSVRFDGTGLRRLTYTVAPSFDPFLMQDGRILFSLANPARTDLLAVGLDGTDYAPFSGTQGKRVKRAACVTGKGDVVFVESDGPDRNAPGTLGTLSIRRNLHSYRALTNTAAGLFADPSPLPDGSILVSRRAASTAAAAIFRLDLATGERTLLYEKAGVSAGQPVALATRPEPDGHSSVVEDDQNWARFYGLTVYENDLKPEWMPRGTAKRLRVIEGVLSRGAGAPRKRLLGELDLAEDGSFHIQVPPNIPIQLQILDKDGFALRTSAWIWAKNKENRGCIGCHEDNERTPENVFPQAVGQAAAELTLAPERRRTVDFRRDVQPVLAKCATPACHTGGTASLVAPPNVTPGAARTSPLLWPLTGRNTSRPWDSPAKTTPKPHPATGISAGDLRTIIEWIDLGAAPGGKQ